MPTHQDIVPEPHTRTSKRIPKIVKDKVFIQGITCPPMQSIFKTSIQGPFEDDFNRISTRPSHNDLHEIMQGPLGGFHQALYKSFSQGLGKDLDQDLPARTPKRILQDRHEITCCWRGSYKVLIQEPLKSSQKSFQTSTSNTWHLQDLHIFMQGPLGKDLTRISTRSSHNVPVQRSCKNLLESTSQGSPQDLPKRTCARSCKDLFGDVSRIFAKSSHKNLHKIMQGLLTGFHQDLHNTFSQGPLQDLGQELREEHGPPRLHHKAHDRHRKPSREFVKFLYQHLKESAKISTAPQREQSDTHQVPRGSASAPAHV